MSWENLFLPYANNKGTDLRCLDSIMPLVSISKICLTWSEIPKTDFLMMWLIYSCCWVMLNWFIIIVIHNIQLIRIQETGCLLVSDWSKIVPLCDVIAAIGPWIRKQTFNQSELVKRTREFAEWPLDMYHSIGHVSPCIVWITLLTFTSWNYPPN